MKSLIDKYKMQGIILALSVLLGCVSGISGKELLPYSRKTNYHLKALMQVPLKRSLPCGDDFLVCITPKDLEELRVYILSMQSLVNKYEHATEVLND